MLEAIGKSESADTASNNDDSKVGHLLSYPLVQASINPKVNKRLYGMGIRSSYIGRVPRAWGT